MDPRAFVVTPRDYAPALDVLGARVTVLASNAATGAYEIPLQRGEEGTGPPLHSHDWDGGLATRMCTALGTEIPPGSADQSHAIDVLRRHGVTVAG